jgi:hypothetical protein
LPAHSWDWPTDTYLQRRLLVLRGHASTETKAETPAGSEKCQDKDIFSPARMLDPLLERGDSQVGKKPRKRRRISRAVGAMKQRRQSS